MAQKETFYKNSAGKKKNKKKSTCIQSVCVCACVCIYIHKYIYTVSDFYDYKHTLIGLRCAKGCVMGVRRVFIFLWKSNLSV